MFIRIDDDFEIEADDYNFTLYRVHTRKEGAKAGERYRVPAAYCYRLEHALDAYAQRALKGAPTTDLAGFRAAAAAVQAAVEKAGGEFLEKFPPRVAK